MLWHTTAWLTITLSQRSGIYRRTIQCRKLEAAKRALAIDGTLADAHTSLAVVLHWYDWDWAAAEKEYQRAIELNPNDPRTRQYYAWNLSQLGSHLVQS